MHGKVALRLISQATKSWGSGDRARGGDVGRVEALLPAPESVDNPVTTLLELTAACSHFMKNTRGAQSVFAVPYS
jgi:hypothetical protein